jgi:hypothetical protein
MKIEMFNANIGTLVWRFYLLMAVVIGGVFLSQVVPVGISVVLGYFIAVSCMTGLAFSWGRTSKESVATPETKIVDMPTKGKTRQAG